MLKEHIKIYGLLIHLGCEASRGAGPNDVRKVVISVNGGLVKSVYADGPVDVEICNLDTKDKDER